MADPYATRSPDLSGRPTGPPPWEAAIAERGGALLGDDGEVPEASFLVVHCRGIGTLAPYARVDPAFAVLLWLEHTPGPRSAEAANRLLEGVEAFAGPTFALKQGCVGGPEDRPGCFTVDEPLVLAVLAAALAGSVTWERDPDFGYDVPASVPSVEGEAERALLPRLLYGDHDRVYEHADLVAAKKRERAAIAATVPGLDPAIATASGWPPVPSPSDWRH